MILFRSHYDASYVCSGCNVRPRQHFSRCNGQPIGVLLLCAFLLSNIVVPDYSSLFGNSVPKWLGLLPIPGACLVSVAGSCRDGLIVVVNLLMCSVYKSSLSHATQYPSRTPPNALLLLSSPAPPQARPLSSPLIRLTSRTYLQDAVQEPAGCPRLALSPRCCSSRGKS